jgi:mono/diheme cytochrome c family protein
MKKILILGILMIVFVLYNCKNKETQPKEIDVPEKTNTKVLEEIDTTIQVSLVKKDIEKNESKVEIQTTTTTEVIKTKPVPVKVENTTKTVTEPVPVVEKKTELATNNPVETKTVTKTEVVINPPVETKTEPVVIQTPKNVDSNAWKVPSKYVTMKNPIPAKQDAAIGKSLFDKHCKSCHGKEGYGDGTKAADLKGNLGDFSSTIFQKQTDGALFYKTTFGREDMPEYSKKLPTDEDRWLIVNYMRTLKE